MAISHAFNVMYKKLEAAGRALAPKAPIDLEVCRGSQDVNVELDKIVSVQVATVSGSSRKDTSMQRPRAPYRITELSYVDKVSIVPYRQARLRKKKTLSEKDARNVLNDYTAGRVYSKTYNFQLVDEYSYMFYDMESLCWEYVLLKNCTDDSWYLTPTLHYNNRPVVDDCSMTLTNMIFKSDVLINLEWEMTASYMASFLQSQCATGHHCGLDLSQEGTILDACGEYERAVQEEHIADINSLLILCDIHSPNCEDLCAISVVLAARDAIDNGELLGLNMTNATTYYFVLEKAVKHVESLMLTSQAESKSNIIKMLLDHSAAEPANGLIIYRSRNYKSSLSRSTDYSYFGIWEDGDIDRMTAMLMSYYLASAIRGPVNRRLLHCMHSDSMFGRIRALRTTVEKKLQHGNIMLSVVSNDSYSSGMITDDIQEPEDFVGGYKLDNGIYLTHKLLVYGFAFLGICCAILPTIFFVANHWLVPDGIDPTSLSSLLLVIYAGLVTLIQAAWLDEEWTWYDTIRARSPIKLIDFKNDVKLWTQATQTRKDVDVAWETLLSTDGNSAFDHRFTGITGLKHGITLTDMLLMGMPVITTSEIDDWMSFKDAEPLETANCYASDTVREIAYVGSVMGYTGEKYKVPDGVPIFVVGLSRIAWEDERRRKQSEKLRESPNAKMRICHR